MANPINSEHSGSEFATSGDGGEAVGLSRENSVSLENMAEQERIPDVIVATDEVIISQNVLINGNDSPQSSAQDISLNSSSIKRECIELEINSSLTIPSRPLESIAKHKNLFSDEWKEAAQQTVLHVHCKKITGELHKNRFGSGAKGKSIRVGKLWFTPSEFEAHCGRSASKDWKRSIRFQGQTLQALIEESFIQVHASSCSCAICLEDTLAAGPVRLYQQCKRRKRVRLKEVKECVSESYPSCETTITLPVSDLEHLGSPSPGVSAMAEVAVEISNLESETPLHKAWEEMDEVIRSLEEQVSKTREMFDSLREKTSRDMEEQRRTLLQEKEEAVSQAKLEAHYSAINRTSDNEFLVEVEPHEDESEEQEPNSSTTLQPVMIDALTTAIPNLIQSHFKKKCVNCNRDCSLECSSCRRRCYCNVFCQRRDWPSHRNECTTLKPAMTRGSSGYIFMLSD